MGLRGQVEGEEGGWRVSRGRPGWLRLVALLSVVVLVFAACNGGEDTTEAEAGDTTEDGEDGEEAATGDLDEITIMWDFAPNVLTAPFFLGMNEGYFEEEGIELAGQVPPTDLSAKTRLVDSGEVDVAIVDIPQLIFARSEGLDVKSIGTSHRYRADGLMYLPDEQGTLSGPEDVVGKTVANFNSPDFQAFLRQFLRSGGFTTDDVTIVDPAFNSVAALSEGQADVADAIFYGERVTLSLLEGETVGWLSYNDFGVPEMPFFMLVANESWIADNADLIPGFLRATAKSLRHYVDPAAEADRVEAWRSCCTEGAQATGTLESTTAKYLASRGHVYMRAGEDPDEISWLVQSEEDFQAVLDWAVEIELVESADAVEPAAEYFTNEFIDEATEHPEVSI